MDDFLSQIEKALDNNLFFVALQSVLSLPDICGALQTDDDVRSKTRYMEWFDEYGKKYIRCQMTAEDCYNFRCSMLHQGSTVPSPSNGKEAYYTRIMFVVDENCLYHNNVFFGALNIDLHIFCYGIMAGVREWQQEMERTQNANYMRKYPVMVRTYLTGLAPYVQNALTIT